MIHSKEFGIMKIGAPTIKSELCCYSVKEDESTGFTLPTHACSPFPVHQVSSGLEKEGFTFQGDIHGKDFGKFKLERQGEYTHDILKVNLNLAFK